MKKQKFSRAAALTAGLMATASQAGATTITFDNLASGTTLNTQYAAQGVVFSTPAFTGANSNSTPQGWATTTDMTVVAISSGDISSLGTVVGTVTAPAEGNVLHSFDGWNTNEDGDNNFLMSFTTPINSISVTFAGVSSGSPASEAALYIYNGATLLATVPGPTPADGGPASLQFQLTFAAPSITRVAATAGSYFDWVAVDNVIFTPVPEPTTYALMGLGACLIALRRRPRG